MKMMHIDGNPIRHIKLLIGQKKTFLVSRTNKSTLIRFPGDEQNIIFSKNKYSVKYLHLFKQIKEEFHSNIIAQNIKVPLLGEADVKYFDWVPVLNFFKGYDKYVMDFGPCTELDISMAYYQTAFELGYISQDFYSKCVYLPKAMRLSVIGSIATMKVMSKYKRGKLDGTPWVEKDDLLRHAWFHIASTVDRCMADLAISFRENFLFYWVDGIYLLGQDTDLDKAIQFAGVKYGYSFKAKKVLNITGSLKDELITLRIEKGEKKPKVFTVSRTNQQIKSRLISDFKELLRNKK